MTALLVLAALLADIALGEPKKWHSLVGFGHLANRVESWCRTLHVAAKWQGVIGWSLLVVPITLLSALLISSLPGSWLPSVVEALLLYLCIGGRSLTEHARRVSEPLIQGDLEAARQAVGMIVSRETSDMDQQAVVKSTIESVLENGSDCQFAPIFWFLVAGAPGAVAYRLANTLDAMWGYRNQRFRDFGCAAAKLDDLLNWLPARLCALSYGVVGHFTSAMQCWRSQAPLMESPNSGPVMAAGAGALQVELGGAAVYHGKRKERPLLGLGQMPQPADIDRTIGLFWRTVTLWFGFIVALELLKMGIIY